MKTVILGAGQIQARVTLPVVPKVGDVVHVKLDDFVTDGNGMYDPAAVGFLSWMRWEITSVNTDGEEPVCGIKKAP